MKILSSKSFFITKTGTVNLDYVKEWFDSVDRGLGDCSLVVTLKSYSGERLSRVAAAQELSRITSREGAITVWKQGDYEFRFDTRKYFWKGDEIHLSAGEALYLYRRLVLKEDVSWQRSMLSNIRCGRQRRYGLGKEFLADILKETGKEDV